MTAGIEAERLVVFLVEGVPQRHQPVDAVAGVGLGVGPVELDVAEGALGQGVAILDPRRQLGLLAPHGQRGQEPLDHGHGLIGPAQLALDPATAGEGPFGHADRLAPLVVERVAAEPVLASSTRCP